MIEAHADVVKPTDAPPGPLDTHNAVLGWLENPTAEGNVLPEDLPTQTEARLRRLYGLADDDPIVTEELLARVCGDILDMRDPAGRLNVRMWLAGFDQKLMPRIAPGYQNSLRTFRTGLKRRELAEAERPIRSVDISVGSAATSAVVKLAEEPEPAANDPVEQTDAAKISEPKTLPVQEVEPPSDVPQAKPVTHKPSRKSQESMPVQDATELRAVRQTLRVARHLFGTGIPEEYAEQFRGFMQGFGLPLFRAFRKRHGRGLDTIESRVKEVELYMSGLKATAIRENIASNTSVNTSINNIIIAMHHKFTADEFKGAFAAYLAGSELPNIEAILGPSASTVLARTAIKEVAKQETPPERKSSGRRAALKLIDLIDETDADTFADIFGLPEEADWQERALCSQVDPEIFFPEKGGSTREAKKVCTNCEVRGECLEYALEKDERFGIWGGLSERERRRLKRRAV